jgi:hypothetical protein
MLCFPRILKLLGLIAGSIFIYSGVQTYLFFEGSVPKTTLDFYHSVGLFFIGFGLFTASFLWAISKILDKNKG